MTVSTEFAALQKNAKETFVAYKTFCQQNGLKSGGDATDPVVIERVNHLKTVYKTAYAAVDAYKATHATA
jgi:hypothetical protein